MRFAVVSVVLLAVVAHGAHGAAAPLGTIKGRVLFVATAPNVPAVDRTSDPYCAARAGRDADLSVGKGGGLADVLVRLPPGRLPGRLPGATPKAPVVIDQTNCSYRPRVVGVVVGQEVVVKNSDRTLHNVHTFEGKETLFNLGQPEGSAPLRRELGVRPGAVVRFGCDVHPWMAAWAVVSDHPFFRVTSSDGRFVLKVPPGSYDLEAWHPTLGTRTVQVLVRAGRTTTARLLFGE